MATFSRASIRKIIGESCTDEMENALVALHLGVVDPLKDDLAKARADADRLEAVQKELDGLKAKGEDEYKAKFEQERKDFEAYKKSIAEKEAKAEKEKLYRDLLTKAGVDSKRIESVLKVTDLGDIKIKDGAIEDADKVTERIKADWADFIGTVRTTGSSVSNPPASTGNKMTKEEIMKITDDKARRAAIAENHEVFGF